MPKKPQLASVLQHLARLAELIATIAVDKRALLQARALQRDVIPFQLEGSNDPIKNLRLRLSVALNTTDRLTANADISCKHFLLQALPHFKHTKVHLQPSVTPN